MFSSGCPPNQWTRKYSSSVTISGVVSRLPNYATTSASVARPGTSGWVAICGSAPKHWSTSRAGHVPRPTRRRQLWSTRCWRSGRSIRPGEQRSCSLSLPSDIRADRCLIALPSAISSNDMAWCRSNGRRAGLAIPANPPPSALRPTTSGPQTSKASSRLAMESTATR